jgi:alginate O-acetyltransferase complex protein AlgI
MLFNSLDFAVFLPIVFILYWFVTQRNLKFQNALIVAASYYFYALWDWRFLFLIIFSTLVDFTVGYLLGKTKELSKRKTLLAISIIVNLGFLGFFKYYNFFVDNFIEVFRIFGQPIQPSSLNIILPVGISFYTFQTMSYTIDIYRKKLEPSKDIIAFSAFVSFFPQLVAGPIERATNLLPQFYRKREFDYANAVNGLKQILWGLFKKMVIADNCAYFANMFFNNYTEHPGSALLLGGIFFAFQIYGDFSGYSDIAIGTSRLFGFNLMQNFNYPYFSRDMAEFWRRWHISLSTWFRDYLYIPLGGSRGSTYKKVRNIFIIFGVSGFWHGANWTFIIWGLLNAIYFLPLLLTKRNRANLEVVAQGKHLPSILEIMQMGRTFFLAVLAWIFFRSDNVSMAFDYLSRIFSSSLFTVPDFKDKHMAFITVLLIGFFIAVEWIGRENQFGIEHILKKRAKFIRWSFFTFIIFLIGICMKAEETPFIYFQF